MLNTQSAICGSDLQYVLPEARRYVGTYTMQHV
jgi:hypothetical protein